MEKDTINYYLFFNKEKEVLVFKDLSSGEILYPQREEKTLKESFESRIEKMIMLEKSRQSNNDVLIFKEDNITITKKNPFMNHLFEIISTNDSQMLDSYNGEYKLIEYSDKRYFLIVKYLLCNYYAKYIELSNNELYRLNTLCETYDYEPDFINLDALFNSNGEAFETSKRYLKKLDKKLEYEIE